MNEYLINIRGFLRPGSLTIGMFLALVIFMPVYYVYSEPERTNYLPGEEQVWIMKTKRTPGPFWEYVYHTEGDLDVLAGIIARDYFTNQVGIFLLLAYYLLSASINMTARQLPYRYPD